MALLKPAENLYGQKVMGALKQDTSRSHSVPLDLSLVWIACHYGKRLGKQEVLDADVRDLVLKIEHFTNEKHASLRITGGLLVGVVKLYNKQMEYFYTDCCTTFKRMIEKSEWSDSSSKASACHASRKLAPRRKLSSLKSEKRARAVSLHTRLFEQLASIPEELDNDIYNINFPLLVALETEEPQQVLMLADAPEQPQLAVPISLDDNSPCRSVDSSNVIQPSGSRNASPGSSAKVAISSALSRRGSPGIENASDIELDESTPARLQPLRSAGEKQRNAELSAGKKAKRVAVDSSSGRYCIESSPALTTGQEHGFPLLQSSIRDEDICKSVIDCFEHSHGGPITLPYSNRHIDNDALIDIDQNGIAQDELIRSGDIPLSDLGVVVTEPTPQHETPTASYRASEPEDTSYNTVDEAHGCRTPLGTMPIPGPIERLRGTNRGSVATDHEHDAPTSFALADRQRRDTQAALMCMTAGRDRLSELELESEAGIETVFSDGTDTRFSLDRDLPFVRSPFSLVSSPTMVSQVGSRLSTPTSMGCAGTPQILESYCSSPRCVSEDLRTTYSKGHHVMEDSDVEEEVTISMADCEEQQQCDVASGKKQELILKQTPDVVTATARLTRRASSKSWCANDTITILSDSVLSAWYGTSEPLRRARTAQQVRQYRVPSVSTSHYTAYSVAIPRLNAVHVDKSSQRHSAHTGRLYSFCLRHKASEVMQPLREKVSATTQHCDGREEDEESVPGFRSTPSSDTSLNDLHSVVVQENSSSLSADTSRGTAPDEGGSKNGATTVFPLTISSPVTDPLDTVSRSCISDRTSDEGASLTRTPTRTCTGSVAAISSTLAPYPVNTPVADERENVTSADSVMDLYRVLHGCLPVNGVPDGRPDITVDRTPLKTPFWKLRQRRRLLSAHPPSNKDKDRPGETESYCSGESTDAHTTASGDDGVYSDTYFGRTPTVLSLTPTQSNVEATSEPPTPHRDDHLDEAIVTPVRPPGRSLHSLGLQHSDATRSELWTTYKQPFRFTAATPAVKASLEREVGFSRRTVRMLEYLSLRLARAPHSVMQCRVSPKSLIFPRVQRQEDARSSGRGDELRSAGEDNGESTPVPVLSFGTLVAHQPRDVVAAVFFELLALKTRLFIDVHQHTTDAVTTCDGCAQSSALDDKDILIAPGKRYVDLLRCPMDDLAGSAGVEVVAVVADRD